MPKCPFCERSEEQLSSKEWHYSVYIVKYLTCSKCGNSFRAYYKDRRLSHTIPKNTTDKIKIISYLKLNQEASQKQIADALNLNAKKVSDILMELKSEGIVLLIDKSPEG